MSPSWSASRILPGGGDACELGDDELGPAHVVEQPEAADEVEVAVRERKRLGIGDGERAILRRRLGCSGDVRLRRVHSDDLADVRRECVRERARPAAHVEQTLVTAERRKQPPNARLEVGVPLRLERPTKLDPVGHSTTCLVALPGAARMPHASS